MATYNIADTAANEKSLFGLDLSRESPDIIVAPPDIFAWYIHNVWMKEPNYPGPMWVEQIPALSHTYEEPDAYALDLAERICSYYADRYLVEKLRKGHVSEYREAAYQFVARSDPDRMLAKDTGIMVKLPDFYKNDVILDEWEELYNMVKPNNDIFDEGTMDIEFVDRLTRNTSRARTIEYWFANKDNHLVLLNVQNGNPLDNVFERYLLEHNNKLAIDAYFYPSSIQGRNNFNYISASSWTLT